MRVRHPSVLREAANLIPLAEAAREIPLPTSTAYLEYARGKLKAVKVAGRLVIARGDLEDYIANRGAAEVSASGLAAITGGKGNAR